jgi:hypothetical protein
MKSIHAGLAAALLSLGIFNLAMAAHPLVTDDTGTQDSGNSQVEINTDWIRAQDSKAHVASFTYTYGVASNLDLFVGLPYTLSTPSGTNDISLGAKWRFHEDGATSFGLKSELLLPSGDENKDLGNGLSGAALTLLVSHEADAWTFHGNLGVAASRYKLADAREANRSVVWRASAAAVRRMTEQLRLVADTGVARNSDKGDGTSPAFFLMGLIYSPRQDVDFDLGVKLGLNHAEERRRIGAGLTFRF